MRVPFPFSAAANRRVVVEDIASTETRPHPLQRFHRSLGTLAITRHDTLWCGAGRYSLITVPNNQRVDATKREIQQLLVDCGKLAAVFCPRTGSGPVVTEYWLHAKDYGLGRLQEQFRKHVRRHAGHQGVAADGATSQV